MMGPLGKEHKQTYGIFLTKYDLGLNYTISMVCE